LPASRPISRWWPDSTAGRAGLGILLVAAVAIAFAIDDDERIIVLVVAGAGLVLYLVWRNILIGRGLMGTNRDEVSDPGGQRSLPEQQAKGRPTRTVVGIVILLAALVGARACGGLLGDWLF